MHAHLPSRHLWSSFRADWWRILKGTWTRAGDDNLALIAAGTAFYAFSSIAPVLAAVVLTYGIVASPETVAQNIRALFASLPADVARLIGGQLDNVVSGSGGKKGFGLLLALAIALYGGTKAASSMMTALNVAFGIKERRGFIALNLTALAIVAGGVVLMLAGVSASTVTAFLSSLMPWAPGIVLTAIGLSTYFIMLLIAITGASALFRFGPSLGPLSQTPFRWGTPGAVLATVVWLAATTGFGLYVASFGNYGATYGALSSIVVLLTWLWLSVYAFLLGAELDHVASGDRERPSASDRPAVASSAPASTPSPRPARHDGPVAAAGLTILGLLLMLRRRR